MHTDTSYTHCHLHANPATHHRFCMSAIASMRLAVMIHTLQRLVLEHVRACMIMMKTLPVVSDTTVCRPGSLPLCRRWCHFCQRRQCHWRRCAYGELLQISIHACAHLKCWRCRGGRDISVAYIHFVSLFNTSIHFGHGQNLMSAESREAFKTFREYAHMHPRLHLNLEIVQKQ